MNKVGEKSRRTNWGTLLNVLATVLLLALGMPGSFGWWPLLFVALVPLLLVIRRERPLRSAVAGLVAGFLYHACLLYWIVIVLGRYGGLPPWLSLPALLLLSLYMGLYMAVFAWVLSFVLQRGSRSGDGGVTLLFLAPLLWVSLEWLRGILFSGFPWMDLGYGLYQMPLLIQAADLGGHHLVSFLLVMVNSLILYGSGKIAAGERWQGRERILAGACVLLILLTAGYSLLRYRQLDAELADTPLKEIAVVQGNVPQDEKWTPARRATTVAVYRRLSTTDIVRQRPVLVVWPETALPFFPDRDPLFSQVTDLAREQKVWLLTGAPDYSFRSSGAVQYFNSALLISPAGRVTGRYDKQHLVPFGEYVPLRRFLPFLEPLVETVGNFVPGRTSEPLVAGSMKIGTLICYESIFPGLARSEVILGANLLVNLTNDAWYGRSSAPYQSFAMAVFRAVENRRSLVRAANTGISGFVTPLGRITRQSPLFEPEAFAGKVHLFEGKTVFTRFGHFFAPICLVFFFFLSALTRKED